MKESYSDSLTPALPLHAILLPTIGRRHAHPSAAFLRPRGCSGWPRGSIFQMPGSGEHTLRNVAGIIKGAPVYQVSLGTDTAGIVASAGNVGLGFIKGLGLKEGAVASTVGHDSHNLVIAGMDDSNMIEAARVVIESEGGMAAVMNRKALSHVSLPLAGLMSDQSVETVSTEIDRLKDAWSKLGSTLPSPHITLAFTTLSVIPELRITDKGLLDAVNFKFVNPVIEEQW